MTLTALTFGEVLTALGYATGAAVFVWMSHRRRMATQGTWFVAACGFAGAILLAKLAQLIDQGWPMRVPWWALFDPRTGGRALLGGVIGGWIGVELAKRHLGIRRSTGDLFALALPAGEAVGRIGCYLNGCCYGAKCDLPWAVYQHGAWRHPAQLYSSFVALLTFAWMLSLELGRGPGRSLVRREGDLFRLYLVSFGVTRFLLEFVRWRETLWLGLSPMQWFCMQLAVVGVWGLRALP